MQFVIGDVARFWGEDTEVMEAAPAVDEVEVFNWPADDADSGDDDETFSLHDDSFGVDNCSLRVNAEVLKTSSMH